MNKFSWLIRRELWEWRSIYILPAAIGATLILTLIYVAISGHSAIPLDALDTRKWGDQHADLTPEKINVFASLALVAIAAVFAFALSGMRFFYSTDSLYAERRERSILFLKSLPISDSETVLSKLVVALIVMPLVALAAVIVTQVAVFAIVTMKLASVGTLASHLWQPSVWGDAFLFIGYAIVAGVIWYLPVVAYYLLISASVPRSPLIIAIALPIGVQLVETIVMGSHRIADLFWDRNIRLASHLFHVPEQSIEISERAIRVPPSLASLIHPLEFFSDPQLWMGVLVAAGLFAATVWVRRYRDAAG